MNYKCYEKKKVVRYLGYYFEIFAWSDERKTQRTWHIRNSCRVSNLEPTEYNLEVEVICLVYTLHMLRNICLLSMSFPKLFSHCFLKRSYFFSSLY
jgi:hypothetical protein